MAETKHTPGPWRLGTSLDHPNYIEANDPLSRGNYNLVAVAAVMEIAPGNDQHEANARLIAAAPEMLAMLKVAQLWLDVDGRFDIQGISAAIAKAEGRS